MEILDYNRIIKDVLGLKFEDTKIVDGVVVYKNIAELTSERNKFGRILDDLLDSGEIDDLKSDKAYLALQALYGIYKDNLSRRKSNKIVLNGIQVDSFGEYRSFFEKKYHYDEMSDDEKETFDEMVEKNYVEMLVSAGLDVDSIRRIEGFGNVDEILAELQYRSAENNFDIDGDSGRRLR